MYCNEEESQLDSSIVFYFSGGFMGTTTTERDFQLDLISKLHDMFPDCLIIKNDPDEYQGIPDLLILFENKWAMLEVKASEDAPQQPNQEWYVDKMNEMSFASFIYPENVDEVLEELLLRLGS